MGAVVSRERWAAVQAELKRLREENERLKWEREIVKVDEAGRRRQRGKA